MKDLAELYIAATIVRRWYLVFLWTSLLTRCIWCCLYSISSYYVICSVCRHC